MLHRVTVQRIYFAISASVVCFFITKACKTRSTKLDSSQTEELTSAWQMPMRAIFIPYPESDFSPERSLITFNSRRMEIEKLEGLFRASLLKSLIPLRAPSPALLDTLLTMATHLHQTAAQSIDPFLDTSQSLKDEEINLTAILLSKAMVGASTEVFLSSAEVLAHFSALPASQNNFAKSLQNKILALPKPDQSPSLQAAVVQFNSKRREIVFQALVAHVRKPDSPPEALFSNPSFHLAFGKSAGMKANLQVRSGTLTKMDDQQFHLTQAKADPQALSASIMLLPKPSQGLLSSGLQMVDNPDSAAIKQFYN